MALTPERETEARSGIRPRVHQRLQVLSEHDLDLIHGATLRILERTGIRFDDPAALELLKSAGARVEGLQAWLPARLVDQAVSSAPARVTLYARDPAKNLYLGEGNVHFTSGFGATWVSDIQTARVRDATLQDLVTFTRLADALEMAHMVLFPVVPQDVPPRMLDLVCTANVLQNTSKHVQLSLETAELLDPVLEIARVLAGPGNPLPVSAGGVPNSPLHYTEDVTAKFIRLARANVPAFIVCGAMAGATAPVTLVGAIAQQNAEFLAGLVVHQLAAPGAPAVCGTFTGGFDMRYTKLALGGPEVSLVACATQQLCERYGVPLGYATGGVTDSPVADVQCGIEKTFGVLSAALAGVDVIHDGASGLLGAGMLTSLPQMLVDADMCASVAYFLQGIPLSAASLAEALVAGTGSGGNYMVSDHTASQFRSALFIPPMRARNLDPLKTEAASSYLLEKAGRQAIKLLESHQPLPVSAGQLVEIEKIVEDTRNMLT
jgi:trimethylamine--corrinoid protein Co-methyltransferase